MSTSKQYLLRSFRDSFRSITKNHSAKLRLSRIQLRRKFFSVQNYREKKKRGCGTISGKNKLDAVES